MGRMIDADALMELYADRLTVVAERYSPDSSECGILSGAMKLLEIQPTIEERKTGKWLPDNNNYYEERFICSVCGKSYKVDTCMGKPMWDFCPCGADMREQP